MDSKFKLATDEVTMNVYQFSLKSGEGELMQHKLHLFALASPSTQFSHSLIFAFIIHLYASWIVSTVDEYMNSINEVNSGSRDLIVTICLKIS